MAPSALTSTIGCSDRKGEPAGGSEGGMRTESVRPTPTSEPPAFRSSSGRPSLSAVTGTAVMLRTAEAEG